MKLKKMMVLLVLCLVLVVVVSACSDNTEEPSTENNEMSNEGEKNDVAEDTNAENSEENAIELGFPIVDEPITLKIFAGQTATTNPDWNDVKLFNEYEKLTNMDIEWQMIPWTALTEKRNLTLASGDYPDAFHTARLTSMDLTKYGEQGVFVPLNDLIDEYAPNFKNLLDTYPDLKKGLTMPDGNIYSFPTFYDPEFKSVVIGAKLWIKKSWLDELGMSEPQTTEEFYQYLKAVKETDLNHNGESDEIPYAGRRVTALIDHLKGSWGLGNRGLTHKTVDVNPETEELRFIPIEQGYKELLQYINKLYSEELLNPDIFTNGSSEYYAQGSEGIYGSSLVTSMSTTMAQMDYVGAPALEGPHGDRSYSYYKSPLVHVGSFAITSENKYPKETVRWIDHFFSTDGIKTFFMGFEGETYVENADGTVEYTDLITKDPGGMTFEQMIAKYLTWPGGSYPGVVSAEYFKGAESLPDSIAATEKVEQYIIKEVWPVFNYTAEEAERMATLNSDIKAYLEEMEAKFVIGDVLFTEWDNYVETLNRMGLEEYMEIYNAAYQRYLQD